MLFWKLLAKLNLRLLMMYLQRKQLRKNSTLTSIMKMLLSFNITLKLIYMNLQLLIKFKQDLNVLHFLRLKCKMAVYLLGNWKCYTDEKLFLLLNRTCAMQSQHVGTEVSYAWSCLMQIDQNKNVTNYTNTIKNFAINLTTS